MSPALVDGRCKEYLESETIVTLTYWLSKRRFRGIIEVTKVRLLTVQGRKQVGEAPPN